METWPDILPKPQRGYSIQPNSGGVLRSEFSTGRARQRLVSDVRDDIFPLEWLLQPNHLVIFEHFIGVLCRKADWFNGPYHDGEGLKSGVLRLVSGRWQVQQVRNGNLFRVSANVEVQDRQFDEYGVLAAYLYPNTIDQYLGNLDDAWDNWYTE
ncbi:hypothetical protein [Spongiibacter tropicus]|uniref:hypothetical protein n=1 Tax=Spongiibacter tropicus TaxID=454602 RepID=UPI0003B3661C|nr:hypothetical protein [Spongiibacter tropicus]